MQYSINGINSFLPTGSVLAYIGSSTTDPSGWIIANGNERTNSTIYDKLIEMNIGTRNGTSTLYYPPNLQAAFLRSSGTKSSYSGPNILIQQSQAIQTHTHTITQGAHTHDTTPSMKNPDGTTNSWRNFGPNAQSGLAKISDGTGDVTTDTATNNDPDPNLKTVAGIKIEITTSPPDITVELSGNGTDTIPFSYGVCWIIKI